MKDWGGFHPSGLGFGFGSDRRVFDGGRVMDSWLFDWGNTQHRHYLH